MTGKPLSEMTVRDAERMGREQFIHAEYEHNGRLRTGNETAVVQPERTPEQLREYAKWAGERAVELRGEIARGEQPHFRLHDVEQYEKDVQRHLDLADERENQ